MNNLAYALASAGRVEEALPLFNEAFDLVKRKLGPDHPETLATMWKLASAYDAIADYDQAWPLHAQVFAAMLKQNGPNDATVQSSALATAVALARAGEYQRLLADDGLPFDEYFRGLREETSRSVSTRVIVAMGLMRMDRFADAEPQVRVALDWRRANEADDWGTPNAASMLGECLFRQDESLEEAEVLLLEGFEGLQRDAQKIPEGIRQQRLDETRLRLVDYYEKLGRQVEAAKYRASPPARAPRAPEAPVQSGAAK
jgi:hypothetical protein